MPLDDDDDDDDNDVLSVNCYLPGVVPPGSE